MQTFEPNLSLPAMVSNPIARKFENHSRKKLSSFELKRKMLDFEGQFIKPKPQDELNGKHGVTLTDISVSLRVSHSDLKRKVDRSGAIDYLSALEYEIKPFIFLTAANKYVDSYVLDVMAAQHIVGSFNNVAGWYYRDFLIRSKEAFKVSLDQFNRIVEENNNTLKELQEAKKVIDQLTQPKIARRNKVSIKRIVADKSSLFHDTTYRIEHQIIKQPKKSDKCYNEHYIQKLSKITKGNAEAIRKALGKVGCDKEILNKKASDLLQVSAEVDSLINPDNMSDYASAINGKITR